MKPNDSIIYHASRLLLLIRYCEKPAGRGGPRGIKSRTLLAKLDFFVRYPGYLVQAAHLLDNSKTIQALGAISHVESVESRMVRYRYGPWDHAYYDVLAYLVGKGLISVEQASGADFFLLTSKGRVTVDELEKSGMFNDVIILARSVFDVFHTYNGNRIKDFIYSNFPEIVHLKSGEEI